MTAGAADGSRAWCGGPELRHFFAGGLAALERCAAAIDSINVFPVPDGDTGTNLVRTVAGAARAAEECSPGDLQAVAAALAAGALRHARGNSGTIFAQLCAGLAASFAGAWRVDARGWARGWEAAAVAARRSVDVPVEGTLLTVAHDAAVTALAAAAGGADPIDVCRAMADAADVAVTETPRLLSVLAQADVVDAGALGLAIFLRGGLAALTGDPLPDPASLVRPTAATRRAIEGARFPRYCTQFLLRGAGADRRRLAAAFAPLGDSVDIVVPEGAITDAPIRVHLHTDEPEAALAHAATLGEVSGVALEDMQEQRARLLARADEPLDVAILAVASGAGMRRVLESLHGVAAVLERRPGAPPSAGELAARIAAVPAAAVIVLPNDGDATSGGWTLPAASDRPCRVVPTRNGPEGVAAALAFDARASLDDNARAMADAARAVRVVTVSPADERGSRVLARCDGRPLAEGDALSDTVVAALDRLVQDAGSPALFTIYQGAGVSGHCAAELGARVAQRFPDAELEIIDGGQAECLLWIALEGHAGTDRH